MKLIVGLGNPGPKYDRTRHNTGFAVVDVLAARWNIAVTRERFHGWFGEGRIGGQQALLLKPMTYMNRSGRAVAAAGRYFKLGLDQLLVISDDLALPVGRLRFRTGGSAGGHKGLQDIIDRVNSDLWCRLRVGIGEAVGDPTQYVLTRFTKEEEELISQSTERAADAVECWLDHGPATTMTRFNADPSVKNKNHRSKEL